MKLLQSYDFAGGPEFTFSVDYSQSGTSLISNKSGIGGIDFAPADGDTVTVYSNTIGTSGDTDFKPGLNNSLYWLVSNDFITDRDTIINTGTSISVSLVGGRYEGSFVLSNPDDFQYLYIVSDYTNNIPSGGNASYTFPANAQEVIDASLTGNAGLVSIEYTTAEESRIAVEYQGEIVADTGVIPAGNDFLRFTKTSTSEDPVRIAIINSGLSNAITIEEPVVALKSFYVDTTKGTLSDVCSQQATTIMYHNGLSTLPVAGDIIYIDSAGASVFDGGNAYHVISAVAMPSPSPTSVYAAILSDGSVSATGSCVCSEVAVPVITQGDITVTQNQEFSVYVEVTNNPNSWTLVTTCNEYQLDGGVRGAVFTYTDCDVISKRATASSNQILTVCASIAPTVLTGTGTVTLIGPCQDKSLPLGVKFNDGIISGKAVNSGTQTIELMATNCFGDSANATFDVIVESSINLTPVPIDINHPSVDGTTACALTGEYELLYHDGKSQFPDIGNKVYIDYKATRKFSGGKLWFNILDCLYSVEIDELGTVIDKFTC